MSNNWIRIWQPVDVESLKKHLLVVGDLTGDCGHCREIGIKYAEAKQCPSCGTEFKFMAARNATGSAKNSASVVQRIKKRRPDLTFVDYDDFKSLTGKQNARDLLG